MATSAHAISEPGRAKEDAPLGLKGVRPSVAEDEGASGPAVTAVGATATMDVARATDGTIAIPDPDPTGTIWAGPDGALEGSKATELGTAVPVGFTGVVRPVGS